MILIGELVNATRKTVAGAIEKRDSSYIKELIERQIKNGALYVDLNAGRGKGMEKEKDDMSWLVDTANAFPDTGICIDSSSPEVIKHCLPGIKSKSVIINSINGEKERIEGLLPVIKENPFCGVVALTMDDRGIPPDVDTRVDITGKLVSLLEKEGIKRENIFIDALVQPVSTDSNNGKVFMESIRTIKKDFPGIMTTCGLSNISFGLPGRNLINRYFLAMAIAYGLDSAIADPLDEGLKEAVCLAEALAGKDEYCMNYIKAFREIGGN